MTARGVTFLLAAAGLAGWGQRAGWPELTALGGAAVLLVLAGRALVGRRPRALVSVDRAGVRVVRGQPAAVSMTVQVDGGTRWLRVVEGPVARPEQSLRLPVAGADGRIILRIPVDTSTRGQRRVGPYSIVHGDPWGVVRGVAGRTEGGMVTVQPRVHHVRRSLTTSFRGGDADAVSRRAGDQHFHALREYVLGDEPRSVHWRSSARAGRLVVRQSVAAASTGTTIVLDVDSSAYAAAGSFATGWDRERFEEAVEVAASLAAAQAGSTDQVHLVTTGRGAVVTSAASGAVNALLDALSVVQALPPLETAPDEVSAVVRRTRAAHVIVVTGSPGHQAVQALAAAARSSSMTAVFVGAGGGAGEYVSVPGATAVRVGKAADLVTV